MYCQDETLPLGQNVKPQLSWTAPIKVFTDIAQVSTFLTDPRFQITKENEGANILWCKKVFKDFR